MHEWVKKKVKWSGLQWFFFRFILLSAVPFDCELYSYVSEVLSFNFIARFHSAMMMMMMVIWRGEIKFLAFELSSARRCAKENSSPWSRLSKREPWGGIIIHKSWIKYHRHINIIESKLTSPYINIRYVAYKSRFNALYSSTLRLYCAANCLCAFLSVAYLSN